MRSQFVLDDETEALLNELSAARAGNRSFVVREAIRLYANLEDWLDAAEANPGLQRMMADSISDIEAGRAVSRQELVRLRARRNKSISGGGSRPGELPGRASPKPKKLARTLAARKARTRH